jgi:hypothetical protein
MIRNQRLDVRNYLILRNIGVIGFARGNERVAKPPNNSLSDPLSPLLAS